MANIKLIAVHSVRLTKTPGKAKTANQAAVPPKVEIIEPGTAFMLDEDRAEELLGLGAVRLSETEKAATETKKKSPAAKASEAKASAAKEAETKATEAAEKAPTKKAAGSKKPASKKPASKDDAAGEGEDDNGGLV